MDAAPIYDIWRLLDQPRETNEAEIRALCRSAYLGDHTALCRVLGRYKLFADTRDIGISAHLMLDGYWEMWVTEAMLRCVRRGATVIDVGANLGYFTLLLADLVGPEGRVLAFEPNPELAGRAEKSIEVSGFGGIATLHRCAVGADEGSVELVAELHQPGGGYVREGAGGAVPIRRLDSIPGALDAEFVKIDVEGHERQVWDGMAALLARKRPLTIFLEFTAERYEDPEGFIEAMRTEGFDVGLIDYDGTIRETDAAALAARGRAVPHMLCLRR